MDSSDILRIAGDDNLPRPLFAGLALQIGAGAIYDE